ncbi:MAG TPA: CoA ester lyase [Thermomicrobiaceae bacterium]|nr:CoA ester lyase [Thermomicrobiaceae bacterium]
MGGTLALDSAWGTPDEGRPRPADVKRAELVGLVRRSAMFVPANVPRFVEKAHTRGADAIILDLEDSVPPAAKAAARAGLREAMAACARGGADILVRINHPSAMALQDLESCVWPGLDTVMFPKAESAREVETLDRWIGDLEAARGMPAGSVRLHLLVETALGLHHAVEIALASPRLVAIGLGAEDFTRDIGVEPSRDGRELFYGKSRMVVVARLAGAQPFGTLASMADYHDLEGMADAVRGARQLGFMGASCIHPAQVAPLNTYFSPAPEEVEHARRVIDALAEAEATGRASVGVDGKMVDIPVAERARHVLARAGAIAAREARKRAALAALEPPA